MKLMTAIKKYLEADPNGRTTTVRDMMEFRSTMTPADRAAAASELHSYGYDIEAES